MTPEPQSLRVEKCVVPGCRLWMAKPGRCSQAGKPKICPSCQRASRPSPQADVLPVEAPEGK